MPAPLPSYSASLVYIPSVCHLVCTFLHNFSYILLSSPFFLQVYIHFNFRLSLHISLHVFHEPFSISHFYQPIYSVLHIQVV